MLTLKARAKPYDRALLSAWVSENEKGQMLSVHKVRATLQARCD